jgi:hypothetical protein
MRPPASSQQPRQPAPVAAPGDGGLAVQRQPRWQQMRWSPQDEERPSLGRPLSPPAPAAAAAAVAAADREPGLDQLGPRGAAAPLGTPAPAPRLRGHVTLFDGVVNRSDGANVSGAFIEEVHGFSAAPRSGGAGSTASPANTSPSIREGFEGEEEGDGGGGGGMGAPPARRRCAGAWVWGRGTGTRGRARLRTSPGPRKRISGRVPRGWGVSTQSRHVRQADPGTLSVPAPQADARLVAAHPEAQVQGAGQVTARGPLGHRARLWGRLPVQRAGTQRRPRQSHQQRWRRRPPRQQGATQSAACPAARQPCSNAPPADRPGPGLLAPGPAGGV